MKNAKFLLAAMLAVVAFGAQAQEAEEGGGTATTVTGCDGTQTTSVSNAIPFGASGTPVEDATFVRTGFGVSCSANVNLQFQEASANAFYVASGSKKGNQTYKGNSAAGGSIVAHAACDAGTGCDGDAVGVALTAAADLGAAATEPTE